MRERKDGVRERKIEPKPVSNTHPNPVTSTPLDGIGWPHHFDTQDSQFDSQTNEFGSQGGSQGGTQDVVEEWLKEDEHTRVWRRKEKCGTHQRWCEKDR